MRNHNVDPFRDGPNDAPRRTFIEERRKTQSDQRIGERRKAKQTLIQCLERALVVVESHLRTQYPLWIAQWATDATENYAILLICNGKAERMTSKERWRWLWKVAYCQAATVLRRRPMLPLSPQLRCKEAPSDPYSDLALLREAIGQLDSSDQAILVAVYFDEMILRDAAQHLGLRVTKLIRRRDSAIKKLRTIFRRSA